MKKILALLTLINCIAITNSLTAEFSNTQEIDRQELQQYKTAEHGIDSEEPKIFKMNINPHKFTDSLPIDPAKFSRTRILYSHNVYVNKTPNTVNDLSKAIQGDSFTKTIQSLDPTVRKLLATTILNNEENIDCLYCPSVNGLVMYRRKNDFPPSPETCKFLEERNILSRPKYTTSNPEFQ